MECLVINSFSSSMGVSINPRTDPTVILRSSFLTGFDRYPCIPISLHFRLSPIVPIEVSIMIGTWSRFLRSRIAAASWNPSIPGIWKSLNTRSMLFFGVVSSRILRAWSPFRAKIEVHPQKFRYCEKINRLVLLSSTIKILRFLKSGIRGIVSFSTSGCKSNCAVNQKVLPLPSSLSIPISPPMSSTSCLDIVVPSPVPPYFRVVEPSAWEKLSKIVPCFSLAIPIPVSFTENLSKTLF